MSKNPEFNPQSLDESLAPAEKRHMGAMLLILDGRNVWTQEERSKPEMATGFVTPLIIEGPEKRFNAPAGGRQGSESPEETLRKEFSEEMLENYGDNLNLPDDLIFELVSPYMMVVNQLREVDGNLQIDQIAASVWSVQLDPDSEFYQELSRFGQWKSIESVSEYFNHVRSGDVSEGTSVDDASWYLYRPQFLVAIAMLQELVDAQWIIGENQKVVAWAKSQRVKINNGAVDPDGRASGRLTSDERKYLGLPEIEVVDWWNRKAGLVIDGIEYQAELF